MKRGEFLKSTCMLGMCSCTGATILSTEALFAKPDEKKKEEQDWRIGFIQRRFAKLLESMKSKVSSEERNKILEDMGRACAKENADSYMKFQNNPEGFLDELKKQWAENTIYVKETQTIKVIGKKSKSCFCPFVDNSKTPRDFCNCSIGFNKEAYERILGKPVDVKIEESILYGGERCSFTIQTKP